MNGWISNCSNTEKTTPYSLNYIGFSVEINSVRIYFWIVYSVVLIDMSILRLILHCLNCHSFIIVVLSGRAGLTTLFFFGSSASVKNPVRLVWFNDTIGCLNYIDIIYIRAFSKRKKIIKPLLCNSWVLSLSLILSEPIISIHFLILLEWYLLLYRNIIFKWRGALL